MSRRQRLCLVFFIAMLLGGCTAPGVAADHRRARAACGLAPGQPASVGLRQDDRLATALSARCVARLATDLGVDHASFGDVEGPLAAVDHPGDAVLAATWLLVAADLGTVGRLLRDPAAPPWGSGALADEAERLGLPDDAPASALFFDWVTARIDRVELDPALIGVTALYDAGDRRLTVAAVEGLAASPPWLASVLVHEAAHLPSPGHDPCVAGAGRGAQDQACDDDLSGPYGLQIWFLERLADGMDVGTDWGQRTCLEAERSRQVACAMVVDPGPGPLCTRPLDCG